MSEPTEYSGNAADSSDGKKTNVVVKVAMVQ